SDLSSGTKSILCGLITIESASLQPAVTHLHSGRRASPAPYAPSIWSHTLCSRHTCAISGIGSTLAVEVVPTVATTARGLKFFRISDAIISRNADQYN